MYECNEAIWKSFNWNKITTLVLVGNDPISRPMVQYAHDQGVRVLLSGEWKQISTIT